MSDNNKDVEFVKSLLALIKRYKLRICFVGTSLLMFYDDEKAIPVWVRQIESEIDEGLHNAP
jgi:hypothetical protein